MPEKDSKQESIDKLLRDAFIEKHGLSGVMSEVDSVKSLLEEIKAAKGVLRGDDGKTPVLGEDYLTEEEQQRLLERVTPRKGEHYFDGEPGADAIAPVAGVDFYTLAEKEQFKSEITPVKGKDYFTSEEISNFKKEITPVKGVDYRDGEDADPLKVIEAIKSLKGKDAAAFSQIVGAKIDISHVRNAGTFMFNGQKYKTEELMHGGGSGGGGGVSTISIASSNGLSGSSNGDPTNPILTLSTTVSGLVKGNGTAFSAAVANTDYQVPVILTTVGTSGAATFNGTTLNIPNYSSGGGSGDVVGPASSTDNAIVRFDGLTGKLIQNTSGASISDNFAMTLTGSTIVASEPVLNLSQTWNNAGVIFSGILANFTNTASSSSSMVIDLQVGGTTQFNVTRQGALTTGFNFSTTSSAGSITFGARSSMSSGANGNMVFQNNAGTDFGLLQLGGATSSFPAIKRSTTTLAIRLADDSADAALTSAAHTITSASATSLAVGPNGATNPIFVVDSSAGTAVAGLSLTGAATGGTVAIQATDSGANTPLSILSKGTGALTLGTGGVGNVNIQSNSSNRIVIATNTSISLLGSVAIVMNPNNTSNSAATVRFSVLNTNDPSLTLSTEAPWVYFNGAGGGVRNHATGALTLQRDFRISGTTHSFTGASVLTDLAAFSVDASKAGDFNTSTNVHAIYVPANSVVTGTGVATNSYGLTINAPTGATTNYAAQFIGGNVGIGTAAPLQPLDVNVSSTAAVPTNITGFDAPIQIWNTNDSGTYTGIKFRTRTTNATQAMVALLYGTGTNDGSMVFKIRDSSTTNKEVMRLQANGNVGIGTAAPSTFLLQVAGDIGPNANDGGALGSATLSFSDLFLASGGVINWNNGNMTLTHSTTVLTVGGGDLKVTTAGTTTTSVTTNSGTQTLTNKRITKRVSALSANSATPAIATDTTDVVHITNQTTAITSFTTNLTGAPNDGDTLRISVTGTTSVALTFGASFEASTVALPTTTSGTTRLDMGFLWNTETTKWRCVAVA